MEIAKPFSVSSVTISWFLLFLLFLTIIQPSLSARTLLANVPQAQIDQDHAHLAVSFSMPDVLLAGVQQDPSSKPGKTTKVNSHNLPFSKPLEFNNHPPIGGVPFANLEPDLPPKTLDLDGITVSFATLEELELGTVITINENVYEGSLYGSSLIGKAQGIYVASKEDGNSHMMAMTACFIRDEDCLRFFGVHRTDVNHESHIAVIGGSGKYQNANGYATIKTVDVSSSYADERSKKIYRLLLFNVYLG